MHYIDVFKKCTRYFLEWNVHQVGERRKAFFDMMVVGRNELHILLKIAPFSVYTFQRDAVKKFSDWVVLTKGN